MKRFIALKIMENNLYVYCDNDLFSDSVFYESTLPYLFPIDYDNFEFIFEGIKEIPALSKYTIEKVIVELIEIE